jgi:hypothetical protein
MTPKVFIKDGFVSPCSQVPTREHKNCLSPFFLQAILKVLNQGPLPQKRPRQKGFCVYRYRFSPFLHGEIKSRRNADTTAT